MLTMPNLHYNYTQMPWLTWLKKHSGLFRYWYISVNLIFHMHCKCNFRKSSKIPPNNCEICCVLPAQMQEHCCLFSESATLLPQLRLPSQLSCYCAGLPVSFCGNLPALSGVAGEHPLRTSRAANCWCANATASAVWVVFSTFYLMLALLSKGNIIAILLHWM